VPASTFIASLNNIRKNIFKKFRIIKKLFSYLHSKKIKSRNMLRLQENIEAKNWFILKFRLRAYFAVG
jgi:hypothetical protein